MKMKTGRKSIALIAAALLIVLSGALWSSASANNEAAVDLVIVLDQSGSMKSARPYSDPDGYRYDAAAVMLNMCEVENSRAAVITFSSKTTVLSLKNAKPVTMPQPIALLDANGAINSLGNDNRQDYTKQLTDLAKSNPSQGSTYLGTAMQQAVQLLNNGKATRQGNQPIILVLADGNNEDADSEKMDQAVRDCRDNGYKVYTVMLMNTQNTDVQLNDSAYNKFKEMATTTGGQHFELQDPTQMPTIFSTIFADQIGSNLTLIEKKAVRNSDGTYSIEVAIPNRSVVEANVLIQLKGLSNIRLQTQDGKEAPVNNKDLFRFETAKFLQYKIVKPQNPGVWKLTFNKDDDVNDNISVNVLFNYGVDLQGRVDSAGTVYKSTQVKLKAEFTESGSPSTDDLLYSSPNMSAKVYLIKKGGQVASDSPSLALDPAGLRFEKTVTLKDFGVTLSGEYELVFTAEGDGLVRSSAPVAFTVMNQAPEAQAYNVPASIALIIEDPNAADFNADDTYTLNASAFVSDADNDALTGRITCDDPGLIDLQSTDEKGMTAQLTTRARTGAATVTVKAEDTEAASLASPVKIPVTVTSVTEELRKAYKPVITVVTSVNDYGYYDMEDTISFHVNIESAGASAFDIADYTPGMRAVYVKGDLMTGQDIEVPLQQAGAGAWTGEFQITGNLSQYVIRAELTVGSGITVNSDEVTLQTKNFPPVPVSNSVQRDADIEAVDFLLIKQTNTSPWDEDLKALFTDENPNDVLTFAVTDDLSGLVAYALQEDGSTLRVTPLSSGIAKLTVTATDTSGETASLTYEVHIVSLSEIVKNEAIKYGLIALAALILFLIVKRILKPSFRGMHLIRLKDELLYMDTTLPSVKRKLPLGQYADQVMLDTVGLGKQQLMAVKLKAGRRCIWVLRGKAPLSNAVITVGGQPVTKKKAKLVPTRELRIENNKRSIGWKLEMKTAGKGKTRPTPAKPAARTPKPWQ